MSFLLLLESDLINLSSIYSNLTLEAIARRLQSFSEGYFDCFNFKFFFQRCKIYELIICGKFQSSIEFFNYCFDPLTHEEIKYSFILEHFSQIFTNLSISQKVLLDRYQQIKKALILKAFSPFTKLLENRELVITKSHKFIIPDSHLFIYNNDVKENIYHELLDCELDLIDQLKKENVDNKYKKDHLGKFEDIVDNIQEENDSFEKIFKIQERDNDYNNINITKYTNNSYIISNKTSIDNIPKRLTNINLSFHDIQMNNDFHTSKDNIYQYTNEFYSSQLYREKFKQSSTDISKFVINLNQEITPKEIRLVNYIGIPELNIPKLIDDYRLTVFLGTCAQELFLMTYNINSHSNLSNYNILRNTQKSLFHNFKPKFMKKEALNKMIIRRFYKYAYQRLNSECKSLSYNKRILNHSISQVNVKNIKQDAFNMNTNGGNIENLDSNYLMSRDFLLDFVSSKYLPPFVYDSIAFKSFNTNYLIWLFNNQFVKVLYDEMDEYETDEFIHSLIRKYDLTANEPDICGLLAYYIKHINRIYYDKSHKDFQSISHNGNKKNNIVSDVSEENNLINSIKAEFEFVNLKDLKQISISYIKHDNNLSIAFNLNKKQEYNVISSKNNNNTDYTYNTNNALYDINIKSDKENNESDISMHVNNSFNDYYDYYINNNISDMTNNTYSNNNLNNINNNIYDDSLNLSYYNNNNNNTSTFDFELNHLAYNSKNDFEYTNTNTNDNNFYSNYSSNQVDSFCINDYILKVNEGKLENDDNSFFFNDCKLESNKIYNDNEELFNYYFKIS